MTPQANRNKEFNKWLADWKARIPQSGVLPKHTPTRAFAPYPLRPNDMPLCCRRYGVPLRGIAPDVLLGTLVPVDSRKAAAARRDAARRMLAPSTKVLCLTQSSGPTPRKWSKAQAIRLHLPCSIDDKSPLHSLTRFLFRFNEPQTASNT